MKKLLDKIKAMNKGLLIGIGVGVGVIIGAVLIVLAVTNPAEPSKKDPADTTVKLEETTGDETTGAEETTDGDTTASDTTASDTTADTTAAITTQTPPSTTAPVVTTPPVTNNGGDEGGGGLGIGGTHEGGGNGTTVPPSGGTASGNVPVPQASSTKDAFPTYITTTSGKKLIHTYSDRPVDAGEDTSTNYKFIPFRSTTNFPKADGEYNNASAMIKDIRPGLIWNHVMVGYDGYMFYEDTKEDFLGTSVLNGSVYNRAKEMLESSQQWAQQHGMKFYIVIAPNKNTVYPDYMPDGYTMASYRRYDQFVKLINDAGITAVDLRAAMAQSVKAAPQKNLYYKYDTHWNNHAGFIAYQETMKMIKKDFPGAVIHQKSEYQINYDETYMKDQAYYLGQYSYYKDYGPIYTLKSANTAKLVEYDPIQGWGQFAFAYEVTSGNDRGFSDKLKWLQYKNDYNKNAPNAYILRDSYSIAMIPFFKDSFHLSTYNWTFSLNSCKSEILKYDTDVIIAIIAERNLKNYVNQKEVTD